MSLLYKWAAESNGSSSEENRPLIDRCAARWISALRINSLIKKTYTVLRKNMVLYGISGAPTRPTHSASKQIQYTTMSLRLANVRNYIVSWAELRGYTWHGKYGVRLIGRFVCLFVFILHSSALFLYQFVVVRFGTIYVVAEWPNMFCEGQKRAWSVESQVIGPYDDCLPQYDRCHSSQKSQSNFHWRTNH